MKLFGLTVLILVLVGCVRNEPAAGTSSPNKETPGVEMRTMALTTPVDKLGFSSDSAFPSAYGVLTDWNLGDFTVTILSMRDGTASLYTTSTFGMIGGQSHERVRLAAIRYVKEAERHVGASKPVTDFPYPKPGQVYFYLLTYDGVRRCVGDETGIERGSDPTRPLFAAAQDVMTELRLLMEHGDAGGTGPAALDEPDRAGTGGDSEG